MGSSLSRSLQRYQKISHKTSNLSSFHIRKTIPTLCESYGPFSRALLAQKDDDGHEQAIYYLSKTLIGTESRYNSIEKECLALVFVIQKIRHYLVDQTIHVIFRVNPLRLLMTKPGLLNSRLAKWALLVLSLIHI